ncbi:C3HC zinc finger protein [Aspergillus steynii IBT 23096]|uniref:C3HC zinc finger protein n=1 Tax=Aspergillus steynii IBT 23096 TaxID=1392250 RepID=A0A2I2GRM7_9EURO|nr:C3HC zinc finger protein [Aspergillus steynii IBT 23096]PLB55513.1 C3HC zinc finger protein [Aspergillus steynii IBT 23096]
MSYAVETKKRKFHRVLESLTKPSTPEPPSKPAPPTPREPTTSADLSAKKARLTGGQNGTDLASVRKTIVKVNRPDSRDSASPRPTFVPWDRERFLERLATFRRVDRWSPKPSAISEVEWAKRGWICSDVSRVTCVGGCGGSVVVKLPDELDELDGYDSEKVQERREVRDRLVKEYVDIVVQGHGESCPWRNKGCDATIHRLPLANPDTAISALRARYSHLSKMATQLPDYDVLQTPKSYKLEDIKKTLPSAGFTDPEPDAENTEVADPPSPSPAGKQPPAIASNGKTEDSTHEEPTLNRTAFVLASFGWDSVSDGAAGLAECSACFRRLGLWMYKPKPNGDSAIYDALDAANEHMEYCPWINGEAQSGTGKTGQKPDELHSGWAILVQALRVKHRRRIRSTASVASFAASESPSTDDPVVDDANIEAKKASDREWWTKLRKMRQVLNVKSPKRKSTTG